MRFTGVRAAAVVITAGLALAACGQAADDGPSAAPVAAPVAAPRAADPMAIETCAGDGKPAVASIEPRQSNLAWYRTNNASLQRIIKQNRLIVGTSGDVLLWGARNPETGQLEGFDIEVLKRIAEAIKPGLPITYKVINYANRLPVLAGQNVDGDQVDIDKVDVVAHTMTINCARWNKILFSTEYYRAGQKVLARYNPVTGKPLASSLADLKGQKVCAATGSTNIDNLNTANTEQGLEITPVEVDDLGECLVKFQQGAANAITGDDTVLAGFAAQDKYSRVVGDRFSVEPYGLGFRPEDTGFAEFVNLLLEQWRSDGTLDDIWKATMGKGLDTSPPASPPAVYGRAGLVPAS